MRKKAIIIFLIVALAAAGFSLWLYEILTVKGWSDLAWLGGTLYSPYIITLLVVIAYLVPFLMNRKLKPGWLLLSVVLLYAVSFSCYKAGEWLSYIPYSRWGFRWDIPSVIILTAFTLGVFLFLGLSYWFVTNYFITRNSKKNIFLISMLAILPIPLSFLMVHIYSFDYQEDTGWIDAVKMGYPMFWITVVMGISGWKIESQQETGKGSNSRS